MTCNSFVIIKIYLVANKLTILSIHNAYTAAPTSEIAINGTTSSVTPGSNLLPDNYLNSLDLKIDYLYYLEPITKPTKETTNKMTDSEFADSNSTSTNREYDSNNTANGTRATTASGITNDSTRPTVKGITNLLSHFI
jgi:hypothetical protein